MKKFITWLKANRPVITTAARREAEITKAEIAALTAGIRCGGEAARDTRCMIIAVQPTMKAGKN